MDDFDIFLAEQMKNERFKKSFLKAKTRYILSVYCMRKKSHIPTRSLTHPSHTTIKVSVKRKPYKMD